MNTTTSENESAADGQTTDSVAFTEEMKGFMTVGSTDHDSGYRTGKGAGTSIMFHLTITVHDVDSFVDNPRHDTEDVKGYVESPALGGRLPVEKARFNLFVDADRPNAKKMLYRLFFRDGGGVPLTLSGFKDIVDDSGMDLWADTTTLFTNILKGHVEEEEENALRESGGLTGHIYGSGIIHIYFFDFLKQLTTFRVEAGTTAEKISAGTAFGKLFMGELWNVYGSKITDGISGSGSE